MSTLLEPIKLGQLQLKNKIIMSPLTRCRADAHRVPTPMMKEYYVQRATAGLIISEATSISPMAIGYPNTPGIWTEEQTEGWRDVVDAVHNAGGKIVLQLWHVGRISDPIYLNGELPVSASAIKPAGHPSLVRPKKEFVTPRALSTEDIQQVVAEYKHAAENAKRAGFDGVEIHGANGYLLDQFLQDSTNKRTDTYGGSLENRARLMLQVTDAICEVWPASRVGMHLAPRCDAHDMGDSNPLATFKYVCQELGKRNIAFICSRAALQDDDLAKKLKDAFAGPYIINQALTQADAELAIENGIADAAAWGVLFIANPDLVRRFSDKTELNEPKPDYFYFGEEKGYTDYKTLNN
jgi:2,4-dienoyl-CoA reductase-like NADH-dependent reductase (Old Yellow Enzyme family)